jgi:hypothetical protein
MRSLPVFWVALASLLSCLVLATASAQDAWAGSNNNQSGGLSSHPEDPGVFLQEIEQREAERESLFQVSPLGGLRDRMDRVIRSPSTRTGPSRSTDEADR